MDDVTTIAEHLAQGGIRSHPARPAVIADCADQLAAALADDVLDLDELVELLTAAGVPSDILADVVEHLAPVEVEVEVDPAPVED